MNNILMAIVGLAVFAVAWSAAMNLLSAVLQGLEKSRFRDGIIHNAISVIAAIVFLFPIVFVLTGGFFMLG
jgi:hypothetical protein